MWPRLRSASRNPSLQLVCELLAARAHDPAVREHVHEIGHDVIEQPLVVRDHEHRALGTAQSVHTAGDDAKSLDAEPRIRLVEDREPRLEDRHLENLVALLLAAGKTFVHGALEELLIHFDALGLLAHARKSMASSSLSPRARRTALRDVFRK